MLATFGDVLDAAAHLPKETWSSIGTGIGLAVLAILGVVSTRKGAADKAAQPATLPPPTASAGGSFTFLADAQTEREILDELRALRRDQADARAADERRRQDKERHDLEEENSDLKQSLAEMEDRLRAGQRTTHSNQGGIEARLSELMDMLSRMQTR